MLGVDWSEHWMSGGDEDHVSNADGSSAMMRSQGGYFLCVSVFSVSNSVVYTEIESVIDLYDDEMYEYE